MQFSNFLPHHVVGAKKFNEAANKIIEANLFGMELNKPNVERDEKFKSLMKSMVVRELFSMGGLSPVLHVSVNSKDIMFINMSPITIIGVPQNQTNGDNCYFTYGVIDCPNEYVDIKYKNIIIEVRDWLKLSTSTNKEKLLMKLRQFSQRLATGVASYIDYCFRQKVKLDLFEELTIGDIDDSSTYNLQSIGEYIESVGGSKQWFFNILGEYKQFKNVPLSKLVFVSLPENSKSVTNQTIKCPTVVSEGGKPTGLPLLEFENYKADPNGTTYLVKHPINPDVTVRLFDLRIGLDSSINKGMIGGLPAFSIANSCKTTPEDITEFVSGELNLRTDHLKFLKYGYCPKTGILFAKHEGLTYGLYIGLNREVSTMFNDRMVFEAILLLGYFDIHAKNLNE